MNALKMVSAVVVGLVLCLVVIGVLSSLVSCAPGQIPSALYAPIDTTEYAVCELVPMPEPDEASFVAGCDAFWSVLDNELAVPTDAGLLASARAVAPSARWIVRSSQGVVMGYFRTKSLAEAYARRRAVTAIQVRP